MSDILLWLITVEIIGLAAFAPAYFLLPKLADRGWGLSKPLGILIVGYIAWILSALRLVPSVQLTLLVIVMILAALAATLFYARRDEFVAFVKREWRLLLAAELVFLAFFALWTMFRAFDPAINHTEQPMDFAFLNASIRSTFGQPEDPWMRGESISYYYFGYWMMGALSEISGVASSISYNLSLALVPSLSAMGIFSVVSSLVRSEGAGLRLSMVCGVAGGLALGIVSNLEGVLEFMRANAIGSQGLYEFIGVDGVDGPAETPSGNWYPDEFWWWFRATRVINTFVDGHGIDYTIQEFPFFSFILGDLHPHMAVIPFALLFTGLALNFFRADLPNILSTNYLAYAGLGVMALSLGGLAFTNMWDLPTYAALLVVIAGLKAYYEHSRQQSNDEGEGEGETLGARIIDATAISFTVIAVAILLYLPYYMGFSASVSGIGAVVTPTRYAHTFIVWGAPLALVAPFVIASFWQTVVSPDWRGMTLIALLVSLGPFVVWLVLRLQSADPVGSPESRLVHILPLVVLIGMSAWSALHEVKSRGPSGKAFALVLATFGLLLIMGPELLFVDDSFDTPSQRMNTVFKLYYQAWILLASAGGFALYFWVSSRPSLNGWGRALSTLWAIAAVALLSGSLYYTAAAFVSKSQDSTQAVTLNGLAFVEESEPAEYGAIHYIKNNLPRDTAILEGVGEWFNSGLISRSTGIPTVYNWPGHQLQWRGPSPEFVQREQDVATIYQATDFEEVRELLAKYDLEYVYIGPRERNKYGGPGLDKFPEFMDTLYEWNDVAIYGLRR